MDFHGFPSMGSYNSKEGLAAPIETFARFQAGFSSSEDFHRFLWIFIDFMISMDCWACWKVWFLGFVGSRLEAWSLTRSTPGWVGGFIFV